MSEFPPCPACQSEFTYSTGLLLACPSCGHEWSATDSEAADTEKVTDANGNQLVSGDSIVVIKDLKLRGSSQVIKVGSKAKNIRIVSGDHSIDCRIDGIGAVQLKPEFVRKVT